MGPVSASTRIAVVGVGMDAMSYNSLSHFIMQAPGAVVAGNIERYGAAEREAARWLDSAYCRVVIVDYDQNTDEAIWVTERLRSEHPEVFVFAASSFAQPERIISAMRAGCAEYLMKPLQSERVLDGLSRAEAKQKERARTKGRHAKVITVIGAKGGTGVTSLALHLALHLTESPKRKTLLVDQHPAQGDASLYLGTGHHQYSFYELAHNTDRLDEELLQGFLLHHESGLDLLDSPEALDASHDAPASAVEQTLGFLAEVYNYVVVDCPPGLTPATLASIAQSEQVAIVITAELPAVRNALRYIEHLAATGYAAKNIRIILNRYSKKGPLTDDRIEKALKRGISHRIPNSYNEVIRAINAGSPIPRDDKSEFAVAMAQWAKELRGSEKAATTTASAGVRNGGVLGIFSR